MGSRRGAPRSQPWRNLRGPGPSARIPAIAARRPSVLDQSASASANRRVFRSKVDGLRPTYGFEDVSLAPGTDTIEPADVELGQEFCGLPLGIPILASAMDAVVDPRFAGALASL